MRGKARLLYFLVKWAGHGSEHNSKEPAAALEGCAALDHYKGGKTLVDDRLNHTAVWKFTIYTWHIFIDVEKCARLSIKNPWEVWRRSWLFSTNWNNMQTQSKQQSGCGCWPTTSLMRLLKHPVLSVQQGMAWGADQTWVLQYPMTQDYVLKRGASGWTRLDHWRGSC